MLKKVIYRNSKIKTRKAPGRAPSGPSEKMIQAERSVIFTTGLVSDASQNFYFRMMNKNKAGQTAGNRQQEWIISH